MERVMVKVRDLQLQETSRKKRPSEARKRREKQRQGKAASAEGLEGKENPDAPMSSGYQTKARKDQVEGGWSGPTAGSRHAGGPVEAGEQRPGESSLEPTLVMVPSVETWVPRAEDRSEADVVGSESDTGVGRMNPQWRKSRPSQKFLLQT
jgi:hypothetical protein